jgi:hypothetical protein
MMKVKDLLGFLVNVDPDAEVVIHHNGGRFNSNYTARCQYGDIKEFAIGSNTTSDSKDKKI